MSGPRLPLPPVIEPFRLPFYYGALHTIGIDYLIDPGPAREILTRTHPALSCAEFDGRACVSLNYQLYFAQHATGAGITQQVEVNVIAYPRGEERRLASLSYSDYAQGADQGTLLGIGRIHVLCDNAYAIEAGIELYAEPKYLARLTASMPSMNGAESETWSIACGEALAGGKQLFSFRACLDGLPMVAVNTTPITGYGTDPDGRLLAGAMNVYSPYRLRLLTDESAGRVTLRVDDARSSVGRDLSILTQSAPAVGVWTYQSPPVGAHLRPYYLPLPHR